MFRTRRFPDYDMALLHVNQSLPLTAINRSSICLPKTKPDSGITCFIGDTAFKVQESPFCNSTKQFNGAVTERQICAVNEDESTNICLPSNQPLTCLSSYSEWYIAGFISYQHGCRSFTNEKEFLGYAAHPTLFSNFFSMKQIIDQTLGYVENYHHERPKINELQPNNNDTNQNSISEQPRAVFVVAGSEEERQLIEAEEKQNKTESNETNEKNLDPITVLKDSLRLLDLDQPNSKNTTSSTINTDDDLSVINSTTENSLNNDQIKPVEENFTMVHKVSETMIKSTLPQEITTLSTSESIQPVINIDNNDKTLQELNNSSSSTINHQISKQVNTSPVYQSSTTSTILQFNNETIV